ncbi:MAG: DinB family protein [Caldilineaceae bacterium]|nr:DinB family protein [Caldilineaceae bacterium]
MPHMLVSQLRFARSEFVRGLEGVTDEEARRRLGQMNSISWMIGHMAEQENRYWVWWGQGRALVPELRSQVGYGRPASTPPLAEMWEAWRTATSAADTFLDSLDEARLLTHFEQRGTVIEESIGTLLLRNLYHYWFHCGESSAVRQLLGHSPLPEFVGNMALASYASP